MNTNTIQGSQTNDNNIDSIINILQNEIQNLKIKLEQEREEHRNIYSKIKNENNILKTELGIK